MSLLLETAGFQTVGVNRFAGLEKKNDLQPFEL